MELLKEKRLLSPDGTLIEAEKALANKLVAFYFSAGWCPPCRAFTPALASLYLEMQARKAAFEVVSCSCDRSQEEMEGYRRDMHPPWLALPFQDETTEELKSMFKITMVPKLVVVTSSGDLITMRGRKEVEDRGVAAFTSWLDAAKMLAKADADRWL